MRQGKPAQIVVLKDAMMLAQEGARRFVELAQDILATQERFTVCLSGGSTPRLMHQLLVEPPLKEQVDWAKVHIFWGDERFVAPDDPENTWLMARETLLNYVPIPTENINPVPTVGLTPEQAAQIYAETLTTFFATDLPRFDLIYLGMGPDGHTASLFPGYPEVSSPGDQLVAVVRNSPKPPPTRLTLTYKVINNAANIIFLVGGRSKAGAVKSIFSTERSPIELPAKGVTPTVGEIVWLLDEAAAAELGPV